MAISMRATSGEGDAIVHDDAGAAPARRAGLNAPQQAPRVPPIVQLVWDAAQVARALARTYERRARPTRRGALHRV